MIGSGKWARTVVVNGPPEALTEGHIGVVATLRKHFYRADGYIGSHLLVDMENGVIRSCGLWESKAALERTHEKALKVGERIRSTVWGRFGSVSVEVSEICIMDPGPAIAFKER